MGTASADADPYDALVLAGGRGRRLGGPSKPCLVVDGRTLLERVLAAVADAARVVVVGPIPPAVPLTSSAIAVTEDPPGRGPVAGIAAGAVHMRSSTVAVLAADLPFLTPEPVARLRRALAGAPDAAVALPVDDTGRDQLLCALWRTDALRRALADVVADAGDGRGVPVRSLVGAAPAVVRVPMAGVPPDAPPPWFDCDTPADLAAARRWAERRSARP